MEFCSVKLNQLLCQLIIICINYFRWVFCHFEEFIVICIDYFRCNVCIQGIMKLHFSRSALIKRSYICCKVNCKVWLLLTLRCVQCGVIVGCHLLFFVIAVCMYIQQMSKQKFMYKLLMYHKVSFPTFCHAVNLIYRDVTLQEFTVISLHYCITVYSIRLLQFTILQKFIQLHYSNTANNNYFTLLLYLQDYNIEDDFKIFHIFPF